MKTSITFHSNFRVTVRVVYEEENRVKATLFCSCPSNKIAETLALTLNALHDKDKQELIESL